MADGDGMYDVQIVPPGASGGSPMYPIYGDQPQPQAPAGYQPSQSGVGGFMQNVGQFLTGSNNNFTNAAFLPAAATALQQWQQAGQYRDLGNQAADRADPFGQYRRGYGDMLQGLYQDPSRIAQTPGYKFTMDQTLDNTQARLASQGFSGSSQMQNALAQQSAGLASQTWNQEANRLAQLAGSQFDPANAARMQMEGGKLQMDAQSNALGALMYPFGPGAGGTTINNSGGSGGGPGGGGMGMPNMGGGPSNWFQRAAGQAGPGGIMPAAGTVMNLWNKYLSDPGSISQGDMNLLNSMGFDVGGGGGSDFASGGYDPTGFGGWGTAAGDPTLQGIGWDNPNYSIFDNPLGGAYSDLPSGGDINMDGFMSDPFGGGGINLDDLWGDF
jgi:hypothetical protein